MKRVLVIILILIAVGFVASAVARTWKSSNGRFSIDAELVDFDQGKAQLKKDDGSVISVPLLSLSAADQQFVKAKFPGAAEENIRPGAEYREWKSRNGKFTATAEFVGSSDGSVQLRKPDGNEIAVELKQLSPADQRWVAAELRRLHEDEGVEEEAKPAERKLAEKKPAKDKPHTKAPTQEKASAQEITGKIDEQDIAMKLVRLDQPKGKTRAKGGVPADYVLRLITPQQFYMQTGRENGSNDTGFNTVVRKEPKYNAPIPFRGVARFGSGRYGFVLDISGAKSAGYDRLYFDLNGNGDLTDDKPIAAASVNTPNAALSQSQFPRVDLKIDVDGKSADYAFLLGAICQKSPTDAYATVSLYSAAVREGTIAQGSKRTKLLLLDHNSNGRFDDTLSVHSAHAASEGDLLLVNPNPKNKLSADATMGSDRYFVSKTVCFGKDFYRMEISPSGEQLKLTPGKLSLGNVTNPSPAYRAVLFCEEYGVVMLGGVKDQKIPLPEGKWKVLNYTIDASGFAGGAGTAVAATFAEQASVVTVSKEETAKLEFGAPFHAVVTANRTNTGKVSLSLGIVGAAGERCTSFFVNGSRPPKPRFAIKDSTGKMVHQGSFEYG